MCVNACLTRLRGERLPLLVVFLLLVFACLVLSRRPVVFFAIAFERSVQAARDLERERRGREGATKAKERVLEDNAKLRAEITKMEERITGLEERLTETRRCVFACAGPACGHLDHTSRAPSRCFCARKRLKGAAKKMPVMD